MVPARLDAGLEVLRSWGLDVQVGVHARGTHERFGYLASDDAARAEDFMRAWCDPAVQAVFCARGGYGVQRMVDLLDWESLAAAGPKALVGFSDVTALHQAFAARLGLSTIHGPVVTSLGAGDDASREHLRALLFEPVPGTSLTPGGTVTLVPGRAEGVLVGGNIALLASEVGTRNSLRAAESIAVLEEIGEEVYRVDRMLTQLLRTGWFDEVRGIVLGGVHRLRVPRGAAGAGRRPAGAARRAPAVGGADRPRAAQPRVRVRRAGDPRRLRGHAGDARGGPALSARRRAAQAAGGSTSEPHAR